MARREEALAVYEAAAQWASVALEDGGSLFEPELRVWTSVTVDDLHERFVENPIHSSEDFLTKFRRQLNVAPKETYLLAAEILYLNLLAPSNASAATKRQTLETVLSWMPGEEALTVPPELSAALESGVGSFGPALTYRPAQITLLIEFARAWKDLPSEERLGALTEPWAFKQVLFSVSANSAYSQREALLHLVFPDYFERIFSRDQKRKVLARFRELLSNDAPDDVDRDILEIRQRLSEEYGEDFDFYDAGIEPLWNPAKRSNGDLGGKHPLDRLAAELRLDRDFIERADRLLLAKRQAIFYGPPGTGKTYVARKLAAFYANATAKEATGSTETGEVALVQFHPAYSYEDFVEGYRPAEVNGRPGFERVDGPLKKIADAARKRPEATHVLVIDELNRANVARVFGELYFLLEYRGDEVRLQYSGEPFSLPNNLLVICTMNTADRSIALVDAALRRRFYFMPFFPDEEPISGLLKRWLADTHVDLLWVADVVAEANLRLADRHAAIGPSFFMGEGLDEEWVEILWEHSVIPYLEERFLGEEDRLAEFDLGMLKQAVDVESATSESANLESVPEE